MAAVGEQFCLSLNFSSEKLGPDVLWYNPPQQYKLRCNGDTGIKVLSVCPRVYIIYIRLLLLDLHIAHNSKLKLCITFDNILKIDVS